MLKQKGVCDLCTMEFELNTGRFAVHSAAIHKTLTITIAPIDEAPEGSKHVCGKACLHRMIDQLIESNVVSPEYEQAA
jgi:hypothetical protein